MSKRQRNGFSLVEVLLTIAIVGILAALVLPRYSHHIQDQETSSNSALIHPIITLAQQSAIATGQEVRVSFNFTAAPISIEVVDHNNTLIDKAEMSNRIPTVNPNVNRIVFSRSGQPQFFHNSATVTGNFVTIQIPGSTDEIRLYQKSGSIVIQEASP